MAGLERFPNTQHALLPPRAPAWAMAMEQVDTTRPRAPREDLWLPEAEFIVGPLKSWRLTAYVTNWLQARLPILSLLGECSRYESIPPRWWRTFLGRFPPLSEEELRAKAVRHAASKKRKRPNGKRPNDPHPNDKRADDNAEDEDDREEAFRHFSRLLSRGQPVVIESHPLCPATVMWRGQTVSIVGHETSDPEVPAQVVQEIVWELSEVGFRVELAELDLALVPVRGAEDRAQRDALLANIFPGDRLYTMPRLPPHDRNLAAAKMDNRRDAVEALRLFVCRWPQCPGVFRAKPVFIGAFKEDDSRVFERKLALYYCQTFFNTFGRAPCVPRVFPVV